MSPGGYQVKLQLCMLPRRRDASDQIDGVCLRASAPGATPVCPSARLRNTHYAYGRDDNQLPPIDLATIHQLGAQPVTQRC